MANVFWQQPQQVGLILTTVFGLLGAGVAYLGIRDPGRAGPDREAAPTVVAESDGPIVAITLPHAEPELPLGSHREVFAVSCTVCHSTQLVLNQPSFPEKKWAETVHKMVETYGAPITPSEQAEIVEYLTAIRGVK
jgi:cytochrome c5